MSSFDLTPEERKIYDAIVGAKPPVKDDDVVEPLELHDSEIQAAGVILQDLHFKYASRPATHTNLMSMGQEAEERFRKIGLEVQVDWISAGLTGEPPTITVIERLTPFEVGRQYHDVQKGVADKYWNERRKVEKKQKGQKK
jgi:hypothetical protein